MGSWPSLHLFLNEQMAAQILWPLNKAANSPSQLIKGALHFTTADFCRFTPISLTFPHCSAWMHSRACDLLLQNPNFPSFISAQSVCHPSLPYCPVSPSQSDQKATFLFLSVVCGAQSSWLCESYTDNVFIEDLLFLSLLLPGPSWAHKRRACPQPWKGPVPGGLRNSHTHTVSGSCFSFTFNTSRETERGTEEREALWRKEKQKERKRRIKPIKGVNE